MTKETLNEERKGQRASTHTHVPYIQFTSCKSAPNVHRKTPPVTRHTSCGSHALNSSGSSYSNTSVLPEKPVTTNHLCSFVAHKCFKFTCCKSPWMSQEYISSTRPQFMRILMHSAPASHFCSTHGGSQGAGRHEPLVFLCCRVRNSICFLQGLGFKDANPSEPTSTIVSSLEVGLNIAPSSITSSRHHVFSMFLVWVLLSVVKLGRGFLRPVRIRICLLLSPSVFCLSVCWKWTILSVSSDFPFFASSHLCGSSSAHFVASSVCLVAFQMADHEAVMFSRSQPHLLGLVSPTALQCLRRSAATSTQDRGLFSAFAILSSLFRPRRFLGQGPVLRCFIVCPLFSNLIHLFSHYVSPVLPFLWLLEAFLLIRETRPGQWKSCCFCTLCEAPPDPLESITSPPSCRNDLAHPRRFVLLHLLTDRHLSLRGLHHLSTIEKGTWACTHVIVAASQGFLFGFRNPQNNFRHSHFWFHLLLPMALALRSSSPNTDDASQTKSIS